MNEILVIIAIALAIFMLPRLTGKRIEKGGRQAGMISKMTGWVRLAVMVSILWPTVMAFFIKPWNNHWPMFLYVGIAPVALLWGVFWVLSGFRKGGRNR
ncbi:MAG: hypothetical protein HN366_03525 [Deltaproteobacteria bacterium]|jgi:hypothetical protein|nr:hypothetical protein [Deltaproteobacteria bacterium]